MTAKALYLIRAENGLTKIGITRSPKNRLSGIRTVSPIPVALIHTSVVDDALAAEKRSHGEWFLLDDDDVAEIRKLYAPMEVMLLWLRPEEYDLVQRAAEKAGTSMRDFVIQAALAACKKNRGKSWTRT